MPKRVTLESGGAQLPAGVQISHDGLSKAAKRLRRAVDAAGRRALDSGRPVLAWTTVEIPRFDPIELFHHGGRVSGDRILWMRPDDRVGLAGVGSAWMQTAEGPQRFAQAKTAWRSILHEAVGDTSEGGGLIALFGFAFGPQGPGEPWNHYPSGLVVIPRVLVNCRANQTWLTLSVAADPHGPSPRKACEDTLACLNACVGAGLRGGGAPHDGGGLDVEDCGNGSRDGTAAGDAPHALRIVDEFPSEAAWKASVRATARAVRAGHLQKAVLARGVRVQGVRLDLESALRRLRDDYPGCTVFAAARGDRCFLGASPERLVRVHDGEIAVAAVAGSAPRGETDEQDRRFGEMLLASAKDRIEHSVVVEALRDALADISTTISGNGSPQLLTVRNTHHLYTPIRATLRDRRCVLDLVERLHPTPAVGGAPKEAALRWIREHEGWDRGWYAGPIGWMNAAGEGEAAVAIRSALVLKAEALLFAGCGIVADSDPDQEYAESGWKLRPLLSALSEAPPG